MVNMDSISKSSLLTALSSLYNDKPDDADYTTEILQGGTVGDVIKVFGEVKFSSAAHTFNLVVKTQRKWDRHGDPNCWRREFDIYKHGLPQTLVQSVKLPRALLLEEDETTTRIWMEFIEGRTGNKQLHAPELAMAAKALGELQAAFHISGKRDLPYLRPFAAVRSSFDLWWGPLQQPFSAEIKDLPEDIRRELNAYANRAPELLDSLDNLPLTLCQGDVHHDNLILSETPAGTDIHLIDWDCAGYGRMGEDAVDVLMEAFVYSSRSVALMPEFKKRIIEGYCEGAAKGGVNYSMDATLVRDIFALAWGFRVASDWMFYYKKEHEKKRCIEILRAMLWEEYEDA